MNLNYLPPLIAPNSYNHSQELLDLVGDLQILGDERPVQNGPTEYQQNYRLKRRRSQSNGDDNSRLPDESAARKHFRTSDDLRQQCKLRSFVHDTPGSIRSEQSESELLYSDGYSQWSYVYESYATMVAFVRKYHLDPVDIISRPEEKVDINKELPRKAPNYLSAVVSTNIKLRRCDRHRNIDRCLYVRPQEKFPYDIYLGLRSLLIPFHHAITNEPPVSSVLDRNRQSRQSPPEIIRWRPRLRRIFS